MNSYLNLPLHVAVHFGHTDTVLHLIELGASVNYMSWGTPSLHIAVEHGHNQLALLLIKHGTSANQLDICGYGPLHIAPLNGHAEVALSLIKHGASMNKKDRFRDLPLHIAIKHGHTEVALALINYGVSLHKVDRFGSLPLHIAVENDHTKLSFSLITNGASVNQLDGCGDRPLHIAVKHGHIELAILLIRHEASMTQRHGVLPIAFYINEVSNDTKLFNDEILAKIIPGSNTDILKNICQLLEIKEPTDTEKEHKFELLSILLHKLIQHLILGEPLSITIKWDLSFEMELNHRFIIHGKPLKSVYLCSIVLVLLRCNVSIVNAMIPHASLSSGTQAENLLQAHATVDLLNAYKQKQAVKKLQTLCIWIIRQLMYSRSDESFQSLPVPPYLQKMLMLQDIADALFEGYKMWPKCMSIEERM